MKILIEVEVKGLSDNDLKVGDYIEYRGKVYKFEGWEYGSNPIIKDIETGEQSILDFY